MVRFGIFRGNDLIARYRTVNQLRHAIGLMRLTGGDCHGLKVFAFGRLMLVADFAERFGDSLPMACDAKRVSKVRRYKDTSGEVLCR